MSRFVQDHFVAAWESMRPVPRVTIDFGGGRVLERTVRGNVATYLCTEDGFVVDVVPGLCDPETFLRRLQLASAFLDRREDAASLATSVPSMHARLLDAARLAEARVRTAPVARADMGKTLVERRPLGASGLAETPATSGVARTDAVKIAFQIPMLPEPELAAAPLPTARALDDRELLALDSATNRRERDPLVHAILAERSWRPREIEKRIYRDVLHCDLDDPWLGLADGPFDGGAYGGGAHGGVDRAAR